MSTRVEHLLAQLLTLQVRLFACRERLQAGTDAQALHDLRIALRKLRSLLLPWRGLAEFDRLEEAAKALGQLSGPLRDTEVLLDELQARGLWAAVPVRRQSLQAGYAHLLGSTPLEELFAALDSSVPACREAQSFGALHGLRALIRKRLHKQALALSQALAAPVLDRHRLRLLIKRVRYAAEAYPRLAGLKPPTVKALRAAQVALGDWHDHLQWLARAEVEADLQALVEPWRMALLREEESADQALGELRKHL